MIKWVEKENGETAKYKDVVHNSWISADGKSVRLPNRSFAKKVREGVLPQDKGWIDCQILKIYCVNMSKYMMTC